MSKPIDYYLSLQSPWSYLGHQRLCELAARQGATVNIHPIDLSVVLPATGGLPLPKRAPERRFYRLVELRRWSGFLGLPLNLEPRYFPVDERLAAAMVIALRETDPTTALRLAGCVLRSVWAEQRDIAAPETLQALADRAGVNGTALLEQAGDERYERLRRQDSESAVARGVFGVPTYIYRDELFWGQDRLDFLERALAAKPPTQ